MVGIGGCPVLTLSTKITNFGLTQINVHLVCVKNVRVASSQWEEHFTWLSCRLRTHVLADDWDGNRKRRQGPPRQVDVRCRGRTSAGTQHV